MKSEKLEVVRGSGNVFRDLGHENADAEQFKAILAAEIIKALDREHLTVRAAHGRTGIAAADFSRIRNADLGRFTVDRLMSIINRLGSRVEVKVRVSGTPGHAGPLPHRLPSFPGQRRPQRRGSPAGVAAHASRSPAALGAGHRPHAHLAVSG
jgi:predicted XRE-type DNA-binding protein